MNKILDKKYYIRTFEEKKKKEETIYKYMFQY